MKNLYVGSIPFKTNEGNLHGEFVRDGEVTSVKFL